MTDIISKNYLQRSENESFFNILKYLYLLESKFLTRFEQEIINKVINSKHKANCISLGFMNILEILPIIKVVLKLTRS